ncbi:MAG TPA: FMN-binding negative transcriptional regulator [Ilumatobacteraceae bacterium]|nr:FMN-binding negative transcriptional regulator [Ilumatobacteraceae bacterium]
MLRSVGVGHLVSVGGEDGFESTVLPFLVDDELTCIRAHVARANSHWRQLDARSVLLIVPVSDAYVSPSWYPSEADDPRVVPTWNYEVVHVHASVSIRDDPDFVRRVVSDLTDRNETLRTELTMEPPAWAVADAPSDFIDRQLRAIVGIELTIDRVLAKRKLSQNRSNDDRDGVIAGLRDTPANRNQAVADAMTT